MTRKEALALMRSMTVEAVADGRVDGSCVRIRMSGAQQIDNERTRQIEAEGWSAAHDDEHDAAELVAAALAYASTAQDQVTVIKNGEVSSAVALSRNMYIFWPREWDESWWRPSPDPIRNLVKAGALIAAEIDRLERLGAIPGESEVGNG